MTPENRRDIELATRDFHDAAKAVAVAEFDLEKRREVLREKWSGFWNLAHKMQAPLLKRIEALEHACRASHEALRVPLHETEVYAKRVAVAMEALRAINPQIED